MAALTRAEIDAVADSVIELVDVPEWKGHVFVRTMDGADRDAWEAYCLSAEGKMSRENFRARLACATLCDESGARMYSLKDAPSLGLRNGRALDRIFDAAVRLNGLGQKDIEELSKNSGSGPSAASGST